MKFIPDEITTALAAIVMLVAFVSLGGCLSSIADPARFTILKDAQIEYAADKPIKIHIGVEKDFTDYHENVGKFNLRPLRIAFEDMLRPDNLTFTHQGRPSSRYVMDLTAQNPFEVVSSPENADLVIDITVDLFDYGDKRSLGKKMIRYDWLWEGFGPFNTGEQALLIAEIQITTQGTADIVRAFVIQAYSGQNLVRRKGFQKAIDVGAQEIFAKILEYR